MSTGIIVLIVFVVLAVGGFVVGKALKAMKARGVVIKDGLSDEEMTIAAEELGKSAEEVLKMAQAFQKKMRAKAKAEKKAK